MIGQYLLNKNESATVAKNPNFCQLGLNKAHVLNAEKRPAGDSKPPAWHGGEEARRRLWTLEPSIARLLCSAPPRGPCKDRSSSAATPSAVGFARSSVEEIPGQTWISLCRQASIGGLVWWGVSMTHFLMPAVCFCRRHGRGERRSGLWRPGMHLPTATGDAGRPHDGCAHSGRFHCRPGHGDRRESEHWALFRVGATLALQIAAGEEMPEQWAFSGRPGLPVALHAWQLAGHLGLG